MNENLFYCSIILTLIFDGFGVVDLLEQLFLVMWQDRIVPRQSKSTLLLVYLRQEIGSVVGRVFLKILNNRLV